MKKENQKIHKLIKNYDVLIDEKNHLPVQNDKRIHYCNKKFVNGYVAGYTTSFY